MIQIKHLPIIDLAETLKKYGACSEAINWATGQPDAATAWRRCPRGDWMLWIAERVGVPRKLLVLAACRCARLVLTHVPPGESRPLKAIEIAEAWARGEASDKDVADAVAAVRAVSADIWAASAAASAASDATHEACARAVREVVAFKDVMDAINHHKSTGEPQ